MNGQGQPTYKRQQFLLAFIRQINTRLSLTDLQKLVFLYTQKTQAAFYDFIPYKYGPYSFQLAEDIEILNRDGYIDADLCPVGNFNSVRMFPIDDSRGRALRRKAYREYPYYSINSEIKEDLFNRDELAIFAKEAEKYKNNQEMLFTIGYEGKTLEKFVNTLIQNDVHLLCDVRKNPLSRKFGFSKNRLQHILGQIGIEYRHIPELGIESEKRADLNTVEDYERLFADYEKTLPNRSIWLEELYNLLCTHNRIALMCYEKEPWMCHRHVVRDYLVKKHNLRCTDL